jgi:hypothetical protein
MKPPPSPLKISLKVRAKLLKEIKSKYSTKELKKAGIYLDDLCGLCAIASHKLVKALHRAGFKQATLIQGTYRSATHCWVRLEDRIYDITATQFGKNKLVYVTKASNSLYKAKYVGVLAEIRLKNHWDEQSPFHFMKLASQP